jgi:hypothetical protein
VNDTLNGRGDDPPARRWLFVGAVLVETAVILALWAFARYFGG